MRVAMLAVLLLAADLYAQDPARKAIAGSEAGQLFWTEKGAFLLTEETGAMLPVRNPGKIKRTLDGHGRLDRHAKGRHVRVPQR